MGHTGRWKILKRHVGEQNDGHEHIVEFVRDSPGEGADGLQPLAVPELFLQGFAPYLRNLLFPDLRLQALVDPHQFPAHVFQVRGEFVQFADAGRNLQGLGIVAGGDGPGNVLQTMDRP